MIPGFPGLPGLPGAPGGGGFSGSSSATANSSAGPISIGDFNFQPAAKTSTVGLVVVGVISLVAIAAFIKGKK